MQLCNHSVNNRDGTQEKGLPTNAGDAGDLGSTPELGRSPGRGNGNPLLYSCLENSMDRGARRVTVHGVTKSRMKPGDCMHTHKVTYRTQDGCEEGTAKAY